MTKLIIYTSQITPRIQYAMEVIFGITLGVEYLLSDERDIYKKSSLPKVNYSNTRLVEGEILLPASGFLLDKGIREVKITVKDDLDIPYFFGVNVSGNFPFDLPAMVFYLVSRYEEYLPFQADKHGRFPTTESIAYRHGFLDRPVVDEWIMKLRLLLDLPIPEFKELVTYDIDHAWSYLYKGWRTWARLGKDLLLGRMTTVQQRIRVLLGKERDPFYFFDDRKKEFLAIKPRPIFFFLLGDYSKYDKNIRWDHPKMQALLQDLSTDFTIGIHPSYQSNGDPERLIKECERLKKSIKTPTLLSRQHYLKLQFPLTYRQLIDAGIRDDYSMGYAGNVGFRAGIARPFPWYDLEREQKTELMIHPFQVMDVTVTKYLGLSEMEGKQLIDGLRTKVLEVGGEFVVLWHNSHNWKVGGSK